MTIRQLWIEGTQELEQAGIEEASLDARYLLLAAFQLTPATYLLKQREETEPEAEKQYREMLMLRRKRIPLQYILGVQEFMGLEFLVDYRVLIPRQDTEDMVELIQREHPEKEVRILDMCTGSGCIIISLARLFGYRGTGVDISEGALEVAGENVRKHQVEDRVILLQSDLYQQEADILKDGPYDVIVSNPPYIPTHVIRGLQPEVRDYEPISALDGTEDGLYFYRRLAAESGRFLCPGGSIYLEIGYDQGEAVSGLLADAGYTEIQVVKDTPGLDRIVKAKYIGGTYV